MTYHRESLALRREIGDAWSIGASLNNLGNVAQALGDFLAAKAFHEESVQIKRTVDDLCAVGAGLNNLGIALNSLGDSVRARELFDEALLIYQSQKDKFGIAWSNANMAILDYECGNLPSALALLKPCLQYQQSVENRSGVADLLERLGPVMTPLNQTEKAIRLCGAADRLRLEIGAPLSASRRPIFDKEVSVAREALGDDDAFDRAWQEGRAMTLEQAVAYALEESGE